LRILDVSPFPVWPPAGGSTTRVHHLLRGLSANHEIRTFSQLPFPYRSRAGEVQVADRYLEHRDGGAIAAAAFELLQHSWMRPHAVLSSASMRVSRPRLLRQWLNWAEVALIEFPWQFAYCRRAAPQLPMVFMSHNVEVLTRASNARAAGVSVRRSALLRLIVRQERYALSRADLVTCVSEDDRRYFLDRFGLDPGRAVVIPSGSDTDHVRPVDPAARPALRLELGLPEAPTAVFMSGVAKVPDVEALKWVRRLAARRPQISFVVVGPISRRPYVDDNVIATGRVRDFCPYLQASDVALAPVEFGGGTKLKVFDSLAAGLPTITFAETIRGTELADQTHVLVADKSMAALERALDEVLGDEQRAASLASAARRFVVEHHDWKPICAELDAALARFPSGAGAAA
jgi:glycosyltransferase involved in cell wall biosynthesis